MSCLFNSISYFLPEDSFAVRQKICNYLESNNKIIDGIETKEILKMESNNYIQNMRQTSTWGGAIEIQAACNIWNISIIVENIRSRENGKIHFIPINGNFNKTISVTWSGGHYEPIR
tara:strand:+ start:3843 stop:4193 length:351 start_codon:yes stop_codon:yes gene_type:complete